MQGTVHASVLKPEVGQGHVTPSTCDPAHLLHWAVLPPVTTFPCMPHGMPTPFSQLPGLNCKVGDNEEKSPDEGKT